MTCKTDICSLFWEEKFFSACVWVMAPCAPSKIDRSVDIFIFTAVFFSGQAIMAFIAEIRLRF